MGFLRDLFKNPVARQFATDSISRELTERSKTAGKIFDTAVDVDELRRAFKENERAGMNTGEAALKAVNDSGILDGTRYAKPVEIAVQVADLPSYLKRPESEINAMNTQTRTWWQRLTSRPFMATVAGALTAIGACIAAWQTAEIPVEDKVDLTIAAITAVTGVVAMFTHAETAKDKAAIEAEKKAQAEVDTAHLNAQAATANALMNSTPTQTPPPTRPTSPADDNALVASE